MSGPKPREITWTINEHGCWICTSHHKNKKGYPKKHVNGKSISVSRFMYERYKGPIPPGMCVLHNCPGGDNPSCINPDHLWVGTKNDNNKDKAKKGRAPSMKGERNGYSKLTKQQVLEIRVATGTQREISKRYGICQQNVGRIKNREIWQNVT